MIKFISYEINKIINIELSAEFDADIIPAPQQHKKICENLKTKGITSNQLISYGWANIYNGKIFAIKNEYFKSNHDNLDYIISKKVSMDYYTKQYNDDFSKLGEFLSKEMQ
jgi:hypothetical protein